jgi:hypothetical protein
VDAPKGSCFELNAETIEAIASRVAELLGRREEERLADASTVAEQLGVDRDWVYAHADELGAARLGGPQGRLRFDMRVVRATLFERPDSARRRPPLKVRPAMPHAKVKSSSKRRRASVGAPAPSPKQQQPGWSPDMPKPDLQSSSPSAGDA